MVNDIWYGLLMGQLLIYVNQIWEGVTTKPHNLVILSKVMR
jgi:hypothetical protein